MENDVLNFIGILINIYRCKVVNIFFGLYLFYLSFGGKVSFRGLLVLKKLMIKVLDGVTWRISF